MWLTRIGSSREGASLVTLLCLLRVALSARWRFSQIITTGDGRYSPPHLLIRFSQTFPPYQLSDPSRLQHAAPSVPLNGQSKTCHYRHQTNPANQQPPTQRLSKPD